MHAALQTVALEGLRGLPIRVEVDVARGLPAFHIVGLPDAAVKESRARIRSALSNAGFQLPRRRITVSLSPADVRKEGPGFDFPIAACLLSALGLLGSVHDAERLILVGELSLDGGLLPVRGVLSRAIAVSAWDGATLCVPTPNLREARVVPGTTSAGFDNLRRFVFWTHGAPAADLPADQHCSQTTEPKDPEPAYIIGQEAAKRALVIAAAGGHNVILGGPPGTGKTLLARSLPSLLPELTDRTALTVTRIYSIAGLLKAGGLRRRPPFREPHHTVTTAGLVGTSVPPTPGELTLAHGGVLFLDELPEFKHSVLQALRQPLESGELIISRRGRSISFPARPEVVVAAMNLCPCGRLGLDDPENPCVCSPADLRRYHNRVSAPIWDRFDLHVEVSPVVPEDLTHAENTPEPAYPLAHRELVASTGARQRHRNSAQGWGDVLNGKLPVQAVRTGLGLTGPAEQLLHRAFRTLGLTLRSHDRILKIARTIADLEASRTISAEHVSEALRYRRPFKTT